MDARLPQEFNLSRKTGKLFQTISIAKEELSPTNQSSWPFEQQLIGAIPMHNLLSAGGEYFNRRNPSACMNCRNGRRAGTGAGRLCLACSAFEDAKLDFVATEDTHELYVRPMWK